MKHPIIPSAGASCVDAPAAPIIDVVALSAGKPDGVYYAGKRLAPWLTFNERQKLSWADRPDKDLLARRKVESIVLRWTIEGGIFADLDKLPDEWVVARADFLRVVRRVELEREWAKLRRIEQAAREAGVDVDAARESAPEPWPQGAELMVNVTVLATEDDHETVRGLLMSARTRASRMTKERQTGPSDEQFCDGAIRVEVRWPPKAEGTSEG
jgi:hypothetical protein